MSDELIPIRKMDLVARLESENAELRKDLADAQLLQGSLSRCTQDRAMLYLQVENLRDALRDCIMHVDVDNLTTQHKARAWQRVLNGGLWKAGNVEVQDE